MNGKQFIGWIREYDRTGDKNTIFRISPDRCCSRSNLQNHRYQRFPHLIRSSIIVNLVQTYSYLIYKTFPFSPGKIKPLLSSTTRFLPKRLRTRKWSLPSRFPRSTSHSPSLANPGEEKVKSRQDSLFKFISTMVGAVVLSYWIRKIHKLLKHWTIKMIFSTTQQWVVCIKVPHPHHIFSS